MTVVSKTLYKCQLSVKCCRLFVGCQLKFWPFVSCQLTPSRPSFTDPKPAAFLSAVLGIIMFSSVLINYSVESKIQQNHHPSTIYTSRMIARGCLLEKHILENRTNQIIEKPLYTRRYHTEYSHRSLREGRLNVVGHYLSPPLSSIPSRAVFHTMLRCIKLNACKRLYFSRYIVESFRPFVTYFNVMPMYGRGK